MEARTKNFEGGCPLIVKESKISGFTRYSAGAKSEVKAKARDILYELSSTLEGIKSKKRKRGEEEAAQDREAADHSESLSLNGHAGRTVVADGMKAELEGNKEVSKKIKKKQKKKAKVEASNQGEQRLQKPEQVGSLMLPLSHADCFQAYVHQQDAKVNPW